MAFPAEVLVSIIGLVLALPPSALVLWRWHRRYQQRRYAGLRTL